MFNDVGSPNYAEHSVAQKPNKKTKNIKLAIILSAVLVFVAIFCIISIFASAVIIVMPMVGVLIVFCAFIFWKYTKVEYDYYISGGDMKMFVVYGGRKRNELFTFKLSAAEVFANYQGNASPIVTNDIKEYKCVSSMDACGIVYSIFKDENGNKCIAYFEPTKKVLSLLKFYNSSSYKVK